MHIWVCWHGASKVLKLPLAMQACRHGCAGMAHVKFATAILMQACRHGCAGMAQALPCNCHSHRTLQAWLCWHGTSIAPQLPFALQTCRDGCAGLAQAVSCNCHVHAGVQAGCAGMAQLLSCIWHSHAMPDACRPGCAGMHSTGYHQHNLQCIILHNPAGLCSNMPCMAA